MVAVEADERTLRPPSSTPVTVPVYPAALTICIAYPVIYIDEPTSITEIIPATTTAVMPRSLFFKNILLILLYDICSLPNVLHSLLHL